MPKTDAEIRALFDATPGLERYSIQYAHGRFKQMAKIRDARLKAVDMLTRTTEKWDADDLIVAADKVIAYFDRADELEPIDDRP